MRVIPSVPTLVTIFVLGLPAAAAVSEPRDSLSPERISSVRVNLPPRGAGLGFEAEVPGDAPGVAALAELILEAEPGRDHRCSNAGAIRFEMEDGSVVGVGLLPGHTTGLYDLRLYDGDRFVAVYRVGRPALLAALGRLGVPTDGPAFRE